MNIRGMLFCGASLVAAIAVAPGTAVAQEAGGSSAGPGHDAGEPAEPGTVVPSPTWTQDRTFPGTRFWKLDKGTFEVEQWWRVRKPKGESPYHIFQTELEMGITDRIQIDLYENLSTERTGSLEHAGNQIEARIAIDPVYGRTPLNPVIYLEWQPRHLEGDRAEIRLLAGDEILGDKLVGAFNLFYEQNVNSGPDGMGGEAFVPNPEAGITGALSYAILGQKLRAGGEIKAAIEKDLWEDDSYHPQFLFGPNVSARIYGEKLKLYSTCLFGVTKDSKQVDFFLILASGF
jgi:hypothetical protein